MSRHKEGDSIEETDKNESKVVPNCLRSLEHNLPAECGELNIRILFDIICVKLQVQTTATTVPTTTQLNNDSILKMVFAIKTNKKTPTVMIGIIILIYQFL